MYIIIGTLTKFWQRQFGDSAKVNGYIYVAYGKVYTTSGLT